MNKFVINVYFFIYYFSLVTGLIILVVIIMGITALINKYTPTKKTEDLKEYFNISSDDEAALIVDNELSDYKAKIISFSCVKILSYYLVSKLLKLIIPL